GALCASHVVGAAVAGRSVCGACWERVIRDDERLLVEPGYEPAAVAGERAGRRFFDSRHVLVAAAVRRCRQHGPGEWPVMAQLACGPCWEAVIRADERVVVECDLPRELVPDPDLVDETAVRLALAGEPVALTRVERDVVAARRTSAPAVVPMF